MTIRQGVKWNDGKPFTGADVKFTFETGKLAGSELSTMWKTGLSKIVVKGNTVSFVFTGKPNYLDWNTNIYTMPIVPKHIWSSYSATEITTGNTDNVRRWSAPGRSPTAPARARRARCSGTGATTGGRRRRSG